MGQEEQVQQQDYQPTVQEITEGFRTIVTALGDGLKDQVITTETIDKANKVLGTFLEKVEEGLEKLVANFGGDDQKKFDDLKSECEEKIKSVETSYEEKIAKLSWELEQVKKESYDKANDAPKISEDAISQHMTKTEESVAQPAQADESTSMDDKTADAEVAE